MKEDESKKTMDSKNEKILQKLIYIYHTKCASEAKILREAVEEGDVVSMYTTLIRNTKLPSELKSKNLLHFLRLTYFMNYCLNYDNGIPFIEILSDTIDHGKRQKVVNAVKSQKTLIDFLIVKGADFGNLIDKIAEKETIEYAIDENKKSTGVLKRIFDRQKGTQKETKTKILKGTKIQKAGYSSRDWCTILYYSDYSQRQITEFDINIVKSFHKKQDLPFAITTFNQNFKEVKRHIEKSEMPAVRLINNILPFFLK